MAWNFIPLQGVKDQQGPPGRVDFIMNGQLPMFKAQVWTQENRLFVCGGCCWGRRCGLLGGVSLFEANMEDSLVISSDFNVIFFFL